MYDIGVYTKTQVSYVICEFACYWLPLDQWKCRKRIIYFSAFSCAVKPAVSVTAVTVASTPMMKEDKVLTQFSSLVLLSF